MTKSRKVAFQIVFAYIFNKDINNQAIEEHIKDENVSNRDKAYILTVFNGIKEKYDELISIISRASKNFDLTRIYKTDLALLLIASYEMKYMENIPLKVSINEVLNLSKEFSTIKSYKFINGILAKLYKELDNANN